jgi:predicted RNase H-like HicB family nuclease
MRVERQVTAYLVGRTKKEGNWYVSSCVGLPVVSQGETEAEAMASLIEAAHLFIDTCFKRGTLDKVLLKYGWHPQLVPPRRIPEGSYALPFPISPIVAKHALECRG